MVVSQAVLERVVDLRGTYETLRGWLKPGGVMSHQIDFKAHGTATSWDGHWAYSGFIWKLYVGGRPYLPNRQPQSPHIKYLEHFDFRILCDLKVKSQSSVARSRLAPRFNHLSDDELTTSGAFIQAVCRKS